MGELYIGTNGQRFTLYRNGDDIPTEEENRSQNRPQRSAESDNLIAWVVMALTKPKPGVDPLKPAIVAISRPELVRTNRYYFREQERAVANKFGFFFRATDSCPRFVKLHWSNAWFPRRRILEEKQTFQFQRWNIRLFFDRDQAQACAWDWEEAAREAIAIRFQ